MITSYETTPVLSGATTLANTPALYLNNSVSSSGLGMTGGDWISAGLNAVGQALNAYSQYKTNETNKEINEKNIKMQQETNSMNEALTKETWARDDSQLQRARRDAELAGFSPLAALSNNLTNSSPIQFQAPQANNSMIAPQIDLSEIGNVFSNASYRNEQTESLKLANQFNKETLNLRKLESAAQLAKLYSELDNQNLSNAEKASILVASGFSSSDVKKLIPNTNIKKVPKNTSQDSLNKLQNAQTSLTNAQTTLTNEQTTTQQKQQALLTAQTALQNIETTLKTNDNEWYNEITIPKGSYYSLPDIIDNGNGTFKLSSKKIQANKDISRRLYIELLDTALKSLNLSSLVSDLNMADWKKLGAILGAIK